MDIQRASLVPPDPESLKRELQLQVTPTELKFLDTAAGKVYRLPITLHNLGRTNQKIRFQEPLKPQFKLILNSLDKELASGLQMTATVEYHPDKNIDISDQLHITIGNKTITIPLIGLIPTCQLEVQSEVHFGTLVANSKVYTKEINIFNRGRAAGKFNTQYNGELPIVILPTIGIVQPKSSMTIKIDFCADKARNVDEIAILNLDRRPAAVLNIKAHVVEQIIELLNINDGSKLECIQFGSIFFGTSKIEHAVLFNNSPEPINWVAIMQDDSVGEELGTNILQRTDVALNNLTYLRKIKDIDVTDFISCVPNEGNLQPYEKIIITLCFSPKLIIDGKKNVDPSHRQDYAVFLRFEFVGSKDGFLRDDNYKIFKSDRFQKVELALTGTGFPVALHFDPARILDFEPCLLGEHSDILCVMQNQSKLLPVKYLFEKVAHFKVDPEKGKIDQGCIQNIKCSFVPHQIGIFKVKQPIAIIGPVVDENSKTISMKIFHHIYLDFSSICKACTKNVVMKMNPGISPFVSNPIGKYVAEDLVKSKNPVPVATLRSAMTRLHQHHTNEGAVTKALIAYPNDRTASIRPGDPHKNFRTIFTKIPRYNYLDPDFAYTDFEKFVKKANEDYYINYIRDTRALRLKKQVEGECVYSCNDSDIGLQPGSGLKSPMPSVMEIRAERPSKDRPPTTAKGLLSTTKMASKEAESLNRKVLKRLKSHPSTPQEKRDCSLRLTPKQIHQVIVGPSVLNFGNVCINSSNTGLLHVINMLHMYILIHLDVNLDELQKTKQFSFVIPPTSSVNISMIFESSTTGKFWKSFTFLVNRIPSGHILVMAVVQPVQLELSSNEIVLKSQGFLVQACFRETLELFNRQNYSAKFKWLPVNSKSGMSFSIRPASGTVEAYCSLMCEVLWQPSYSSSDKGEFHLHVSEGNTSILKCVARVGPTKVTFLEPRILFNNCPQGLTTWRKAILHNVGPNHGYYKVCEESLLPIVDIVPSEGIIPFGGITILNISCKPVTAERFDTRAKVAIRHANVIDLRIGGSVEIPDVEIRPNMFDFNGTYIGSTHIIPFVVKNRGMTPVRVEFNLENIRYFSMNLKDKAVKSTNPKAPYIYSLELEESSSAECDLIFSPEVVTYEFFIPTQINSFKNLQVCTEHLSKTLLVSKKALHFRPCHVQVTVLETPLTISSTEFVFAVSINEMNFQKKITKTQDLVIKNISTQSVKWILDLSSAEKLCKDGIFQFSALSGTLVPEETFNISIFFCPKKTAKYVANIPIYLNDNPIHYRILCLTGEVKSPTLLFDPPFIFFTPVPLDVTTVMEIKILPQSYFRHSVINVQIPTAELLVDDEYSEVYPLSVDFPKGAVITGSPCGVNDELLCLLRFKSSTPVSFFINLFFYDDKGNWFPIPVSATAENCILTLYPFMATHLDKHKIVLKSDKCRIPMRHRGSAFLPALDCKVCSPSLVKMAATATRFIDAEPTHGNLFVGLEIMPENMSLNKCESKKKENDKSKEKELKNEQFFSPEKGTQAYDFIQKVVDATQIWFSLFGWPEGPHLLSIPETIRRDVQKIQYYSPLSPKKYTRQNDFTKYNKTIYDVLLHLSGQMPPEVNSNQSLPVDITERVTQLHLQHSSLLNLLREHGGCVSHILPEFLLEPEDYKKWIKMKPSRTDSTPTNSSTPEEECSVIIDMNKFEEFSKRAWTDVFLQIYKVLILSRIVPHCTNDMPPRHVKITPKINPDFTSSNIYSIYERILLSWMNTNYEDARHIIWKKGHKGPTPSERWIINFDSDLSDGLVFATQLATYCPFLIESHFVNMYTEPKNCEQRLHNCLIIINAIRDIAFDMEIQATDICDPNPILMLMFCVYMYERLPSYLPKKVVPFYCTLHDTVLSEIVVKNPSLKAIVYTAIIVGKDAVDFSLQRAGTVVTISPRNQTNITLKFTSRFLHPAEASLLLISKTKNARGGPTMAFALKGQVRHFRALKILKCQTPCYQWKEITIKIKNPFQVAGYFNVILVESPTFLCKPSQLSESGQFVSYGSGVNDSECETAKGCPSAPNCLKTSIRSSFIKEFFCSMHNMYLEVKGSSNLELFFLPFDMHFRYCVIILTNEKIGEIVYAVEGKGEIPLPSTFLPMKPSTPIDYDISPEEVQRKEDPVLYLKCKLHGILDMNLKLPLTNEAKERALAFAAQQQMSNMEYERRLLTGTLESSSVRVAIALLGLTKVESFVLFNISKLKKPKSVLYLTELSLPEHFTIPKKVYIPQILEPPTKLTQIIQISKAKFSDGSVPLHLKFVPICPGRYPCKILLISRYDVRVYCIEGIVNDENPEATFQFVTPAFQPLTQNIPIANKTRKELKCQVIIEGDWFDGPSVLHMEPGETVQYPLTFNPILECEIQGKLILQSEIDGMERFFAVTGIGKKPLALEHFIVKCQVGDVVNKSIIVPNKTRTILTFKVTSDLPIVWGKQQITIDPDNVIPYVLHMCPWKRGVFKGKLLFSVKTKEDDESSDELYKDIEGSMETSLPDLPPIFVEENTVNNLKIWYHLEIQSSPRPPTKVMEIKCVALETVCIEIPITNPKNSVVHMEVKLTSIALNGALEVTLDPLDYTNYIVWYCPASTGCKEESVIFQPIMGEEFWYLLKFTVELPTPVAMPEVKCDLGDYVSQIISLENPTYETLEMRATNSNPANFILDINKNSSVTLPPHSSKSLTVYFFPSGLGRAGHQACISFHCKQFKEWNFHLSGVGLFPRTLDTQRVITPLGYHSSLIINFQNPTLECVIIDIILTSQEDSRQLVADQCWDSFMHETSAFHISTMNRVHGISLPPRGTIDIPVFFVPKTMKLYKTMIIIQMMRANKENWHIDNFDELDEDTKRNLVIRSEDIPDIHWVYPIIGLPQAPFPKGPQAVIKCQSKKQVEHAVEVTLTGHFFGPDPTPELTEFSVIPKKQPYNFCGDCHEIPQIREFEYEILYDSEMMKCNLTSCLSLQLIKKSYSIKNETISLFFAVKFAPKRPLRAHITLKIECLTQGIWKFPIMLIATDPDVDDVINIRGIGLFKESVVTFRLTSQTRHPEPFTTFFLPGSDEEFFVKPRAGELPACNSEGTLITVGFTPRMYSKTHKATLVIQTSHMYWMYEINGLPPKTVPPLHIQAKVKSTNQKCYSIPIIRRDFLHENAQLLRTGVSSTIKGAPLVTKKK
ncbi:cilia- and flagella-associated protein 47 [Ochotona curzoniae]|uniref:cilia- and flagella-associated protein 47 n=1 Tax=Ochotona curzoniae TaxID=130825 RepID=UPI001B349D96|nr:cilia- and flagella-associated protein 47 [Ochotona curzoniae]